MFSIVVNTGKLSFIYHQTATGIPSHFPVCTVIPSTSTVCDSCYVWVKHISLSLKVFLLHMLLIFIPWDLSANWDVLNSAETVSGCQVITSVPLQYRQHLPYAPGTRWWQWAGRSPSSVRPPATHSLLSSGRGRAVRCDWPSFCHHTISPLSANSRSKWVSNAVVCVSHTESPVLLPATAAL